MSYDVRDSYFGWTGLVHADACKRPFWDIDHKTEYDAFRTRSLDSVPHACPAEDCGHGPKYERTTVRIVCRSCGHAYLVHSEQQPIRTSTDFLGYGQQPRKVAGLLLWPGEPLTTFGMSVRDGQHVPYQLLVTRLGVKCPVRGDLVGQIAQSVTPRGAVRYTAVAGLDPDGPFGHGEFRWAAAAEVLRTIPAAAKWIAGHVDARPAAGLGVGESR